MKSVFIATVGAFMLVATTYVPGVVSGSAVAQNNPQNNRNQAQLQLRLEAEKQVLQKDNQGKQKVSWQALTSKAVVKPGDVLRYTLNGENKSDRPINNLILNQPIPKGMVYVLKSANTTNQNGKITFSIDGGRSFAENPTVKVTLPNGKVEIKPAPANAYTHIRLQVPSLAAKTIVKATYQTQIR